MVVQASDAGSSIPRAAGGSALIVFVSTVAASLLQGAVTNIQLGPLPSILVVGGLGASLLVYQRAVGREARAKRAVAFHQVAEHHELTFNPLSVAVSGFLGLLLVEFVVGFLIGFGLGAANVQSDQDFAAVLSLISLPFVLLAAGLMGRYLSLRIGERELLWIAGTVVAVRLVSLLIGLALSLGELGISPLNELVLAVLGFGAASVGHVLGKRQEEFFTISYLARFLSHDDRLALIDLTAKAAESSPQHTDQLAAATQSPSVSRSQWCTSCGTEFGPSDSFCGTCGATRTIGNQVG